MANGNIDITPETTVHRLLEAYPELEETLIDIAPPFKKLRNPLLRRSVAKVASLRHISSVGGVPLNELIGTLRKAVGQPVTNEFYQEEDYFGDQPDWYSADKISASIDETALKNQDQMTLVIIMREAKKAKKGEIIELVTSFLPAPGIDVLKPKGYSVWALKEEDGWIRSYFLKNAD
jgi:hypothetical protein